MNETNILKINKDYNYNVKVFSHQTYVESNMDVWIIEEIYEDVLILKHVHDDKKQRTHVHKSNNRTKKFENIKDVFEYIKSHDFFVLNGRWRIS